jgi:hypothetical protein
VLVTKNVEGVSVKDTNFDLDTSAAAAKNVDPVSNRYKENSLYEVGSRVFELIRLLLNHFVELKPL